MKKRILFILSVFVFFVVLFLLQKSFFTILYSSIGGGISVKDFFNVLYNGVGLDMSTSGYLTAVPALLTIASLWAKPNSVKQLLNVFWIVVAIVLSAVFVVDIAVYPYWGYHFDATIFLYLTNPQDAMASASLGETILGIAAFLLFAAILYWLIRKFLLSQVVKFDVLEKNRLLKPFIVLVLLTASIFLPIRGGVTASTMNVGQAYFSDNMFLNHAAINPHFNLLYSAFKSEKFHKQYQFFERTKAGNIFSEITKESNDSTKLLLKTKKPNIILFMLESFSAFAAYDSVIAPSLVKMSNEGINFPNFYANSFRTDRAVVSILSGYPAHPTVALMKYPAKTQSLPSISKTLVQNGYSSAYYYGGDVDFASMRSYIIGACATDKVYEDVDFPLSQRLTKWGVPDEFVLERLFDDISSKRHKEPFIITTLTLSSHEPFDVSTKELDDPFFNSMHYTDREIGKFVDKLKETDVWDNTLLIFLADHCIQNYPEGVANYDKERFHIPMIWSGGAVKNSEIVDEFGSQNDLAATLLAQLGIDYSDFRFSKNMLQNNSNNFAFYSYNNGFSMLNGSERIVYDNEAKKIMQQEGKNLEEEAKAFFQMMYLDLGER